MHFETVGNRPYLTAMQAKIQRSCDSYVKVYDACSSNVEITEAYRPSFRQVDGVPFPCPKKVVNLGKGKICGYFDPQLVETTCLENLKKIDRFTRENFSQHVVGCGKNDMRVFVDHPGENKVDNAGWSTYSDEWCSADEEGYVAFGVTDLTEYHIPFVLNFDILAHEFGHAIVEYTAPLEYKFQSGALDESFGDVFAIMNKHFQRKTPAESPDADWCINTGMKIGDKKKGALRSLDNPGSAKDFDIQPKHMSGYLHLPITDDRGGVHKNCSIPNHAFYLVASQIGGFCYETAGQIWFNSLKQTQKTDDFQTFAKRTISYTDQRYSRNISEIVRKAWYDVGIDLRSLPGTLKVEANPDQILIDGLLKYYQQLKV